MGLRLFAVMLMDGHGVRDTDGRGAQFVPFREIAAVVGEAPFAVAEVGGEDIERYRDVVESISSTNGLLPAPLGTVFRSRDTLLQWLELHYVALTDALDFVEGRQEARVHIARDTGKPDERGAGSDLAAAAAESFRALRRCAVASLPLRMEHMTGIVLSAGFLVDRELWKDFTQAVEREREAHTELTIDMTGPWPPYDFVRMQFGG